MWYFEILGAKLKLCYKEICVVKNSVTKALLCYIQKLITVTNKVSNGSELILHYCSTQTAEQLFKIKQ